MKLTKKDRKEIKTWTKALRSGKYKQTTKKLQDNKGYCCLGVACELFTKEDYKLKKYGFWKEHFLTINLTVKSG